MAAPQVRAKIVSAFQKAYQRDHHTQRDIPETSIAILADKQQLSDLLDHMSLNRAASSLGIDTSTLARYRDNHGIAPSVSSYEIEIGDFLKEHSINYIHNKRGTAGVSLDFYLPEHKTAIEFNGLYWHSSKFRDRLYHREKYQACGSAGISLIMINEDEWNLRGDAWRSRLINILGRSKKGAPARKMDLRPIDQAAVSAFCDLHHIQGATSTIIYGLGAYDGEALAGVMAFSRQRGTSAVELIRFCTDGDNHAGLFSKMFKRALTDNDWDEVISFADLRHSAGHVYRKNGFDLLAEIAPDYRYVVRNRTFHKSTFTKTAIRRRFPELDPSLTERQAMEQLDIPRIYDCGKLKFRWQRTR
ncbi:MAG: hypothetical protein EOO77_15230 [Oxalobacteraceae bacterium]|nr:MAG: hypothetical protein EOO77_15230 [Oxalobacteraceae bacterium]